MLFFVMAHSISHAMTVVSMDDSSVSVLAMLFGVIGGWTLTAILAPKAKKARIPRKNDSGRRR